MVGAMRALGLAVELRRAQFDVDVADPLVGHLPVAQRLELMRAIRPDGMHPERTRPDDVIDEGDGVLLVSRTQGFRLLKVCAPPLR